MEIKRVERFFGHINTAISNCIAQAKVENVTVEFEFNGVTVQVNGDSNPKLIYRDWLRGLYGYTKHKKVWPYPKLNLSAHELARDERVWKRDQIRSAIRKAKYQAKERAKKVKTEANLAICPPMTRDEAKWQQGVAAQKGDDCGLAVFRYAETWARLMEGEIAKGKSLRDVAQAASQEADIEGISGYMYGAAVSVLANCWAHGEDLRRWHNKSYGVDEDKKGVVNPAVLKVRVA
jgi:hypothetical protein